MIKKIWDLAGSMRVVIPLLIVITLVSMAGVLVPQDLPAAAYRQNMAGLWALFVLGLGLNHVFSTWWFYALLGLLALNIVACSVSRQVKNLKAASGLHPPASPTHGIREIGSIIFHTSILFFFIGGVAGLSGGFSYVRELHKGEVVPVRGSGMLLRCDWFKVERNGEGEVSAYKSKLDVLGKDHAMLAEKVIGVNHPLTCRGIRFYQNSFGQQPDAFDDARLFVAGACFGRPEGSGYVADFPFDSAVTLPGGAVLTVPRFVCDFIIDMETREVSSRSDKPRNPAAQVVIVKDGDTMFDAWTFVNFPEVRQDGKNGCKVRFQGYTPRYFTGITIARNPGSPFIWLGFALATIGIVMVFYTGRIESLKRLFKQGA